MLAACSSEAPGDSLPRAASSASGVAAVPWLVAVERPPRPLSRSSVITLCSPPGSSRYLRR